MSGSRRPSAIGRRAYEFTLNSDGGDCDDPILWLFPCFHLARVNSELKAPHRSAGCGGKKNGGAGVLPSPPRQKRVGCLKSRPGRKHKKGRPKPPPIPQLTKKKQ